MEIMVAHVHSSRDYKIVDIIFKVGDVVKVCDMYAGRRRAVG